MFLHRKVVGKIIAQRGTSRLAQARPGTGLLQVEPLSGESWENCGLFLGSATMGPSEPHGLRAPELKREPSLEQGLLAQPPRQAATAWPDQAALEQAELTLAQLPPLTFAGECRELTAQLARVARGEAFLLQAGDCAESFDAFNTQSIKDKLKIILQMAVVLTYSGGTPTVKVGRIAGQFAKPRSSDVEVQNGVSLPSFRGHMVNDVAFDEASRRPDPSRLLRVYHQSAATLNLLRAFTKAGFAGLDQIHAWNQEFVAESPQGERYETACDPRLNARQSLDLAFRVAELLQAQ
jgi:3-deoxy-D-arabino-heptulosonate 7-phosphate (DAHP) synthase class II